MALFFHFYALAILPLVLAWPWADPDPPRSVRLTHHLVELSHLSPLFHYSSSSAWTLNPDGAYATKAGANVSIEWMGNLFTVLGRATSRVQLDIAPPVPDRYPGVEVDNWKLIPSTDEGELTFRATGAGNMTYERRRWSLQHPYASGPVTLNDADEEFRPWTDAECELVVEGSRMTVVVPTDSDWKADEEPHIDNLQAIPMVTQDSHLHPALQASGSGHWTIASPPGVYDDLTLVPHAGPALESGPSSEAWPTQSVLSTSTHLASLSVTLSAGASILQLYGNVGSEHGVMRLILEPHPESPEPIDFGQDVRTGQIINTERPVDASGQLLALVWLDPRVQYTVVIRHEDLRRHRRIELAGVTAKGYTVQPELMQGNWLERWNDAYGTKWTPPATSREWHIGRCVLLLLPVICLSFVFNAAMWPVHIGRNLPCDTSCKCVRHHVHVTASYGAVDVEASGVGPSVVSLPGSFSAVDTSAPPPYQANGGRDQ